MVFEQRRRKNKGNETLCLAPLLTDAILIYRQRGGRDIFAGALMCGCDGFVGNIVLKAGEGLVTL